MRRARVLAFRSGSDLDGYRRTRLRAAYRTLRRDYGVPADVARDVLTDAIVTARLSLPDKDKT